MNNKFINWIKSLFIIKKADEETTELIATYVITAGYVQQYHADEILKGQFNVKKYNTVIDNYSTAKNNLLNHLQKIGSVNHNGYEWSVKIVKANAEKFLGIIR